jgi:hypothetical protein
MGVAVPSCRENPAPGCGQACRAAGFKLRKPSDTNLPAARGSDDAPLAPTFSGPCSGPGLAVT